MTVDFDQLKQWYRESADHFDDWREEARNCYAFVAGDQWTQEDRAVLQEQMRPVITFNRIASTVDSVSGLEVNNRQETRFIPRTEGDAPVNEILTGAAEWVRDECDAEDEESESFLDMVICGEGCTETRMDYDRDVDGQVIIERVDPLEVFWDAASRKKNHADARYVFRVKELPMEEARTLVDSSKVDDSELHAAWADDVKGEKEPHDATEAEYYRNDQDGDIGNRKTVRLVEAQWWEYGTAWDVLDPDTGQVVRLTEEEYDTLTERFAMLGKEAPRAVRRRARIYHRALLGKAVLKQWPGPKEGGFLLKAMTGKRDRNSGTWYGLVRGMIDPQLWANKWLSQTLHIINTNAKGGVFAELDAFKDPKQAEESYARSDRITWMQNGALSGANPKFREKPQTQYPAGMDRLMQFAISSIRDVSGVNLELLGMADREQPGILEAERKRSGMTILAGMFDALRKYRKEQGRLLLWDIREFMSDGRLIRINGEEHAKYVPLTKLDETIRFDVIVDETPASPNLKERTWAALTQLMPFLAKMPIPPAIWLEVLKYSPLPDSLVSKIAELGKQQPPPTPEQQLALRQAAADVMNTEAQAEERKAGALLDHVKAGVERQGSAIDVAEAVAGIGQGQAAAERPPETPGQSGFGEGSDEGARPPLPSLAGFGAPSPSDQAAQAQMDAARATMQAAQMQAESSQAIALAMSQLAEGMRLAFGAKEIVRDGDGVAVGVRPVVN